MAFIIYSTLGTDLYFGCHIHIYDCGNERKYENLKGRMHAFLIAMQLVLLSAARLSLGT